MRKLLAVAPLALAMLSGCALLGPTPAWELPPPPPSERPVLREGAVQRVELDNGLRILVHEDRSLPRVSVTLTLRLGAADEAIESAGLSSYTADLLGRGAGDLDALAFAEASDALGARFRAGAGWDTIEVGISGLSRDFERLLELLSDAVLRPRFDPREAERARDQRLASLQRSKDDPATLARWNAARAVYEGHRFGLPVGGTEQTVARFDAAGARDFHALGFAPNTAIASVTGDVDPEEAIAALRAHFGGWEPKELPAQGPPPPDPSPPARRIVVVDRPDLEQARIVVSHDGISRTADDRIEASLLNTVIGGSGFSSRLMASLRAEEGLTYGVGSGFGMRRHPGPFTVSTFTRVEKVREALDLVLFELERGRSEPPGEDELAWARTLATGRFSMGLETSEAVTGAMVDLDVYGLPEDSLDTYRRRVRAVSAEDVARAAEQYLHVERAAIVLVGPAEAIEAQLEGLGPIEIVTP